jgi:hypothetical protein
MPEKRTAALKHMVIRKFISCLYCGLFRVVLLTERGREILIRSVSVRKSIEPSGFRLGIDTSSVYQRSSRKPVIAVPILMP